MALNVNDVIRITANQSYAEQLMQNVFFFQVLNAPEGVGSPAQYQTLLEAFKSEVGDVFRGLQSSFVTHTTYHLDNLTNGVDFADLNVDEDGGISGDPMPSFNAINVKLVRGTGVTRNGSKRIGGLPESSTGGNNIQWTAEQIDDIEAAFGTAIHNPIGGQNIGAPMIVGRTAEENEDGDIVYVLDLEKLNPIVGAIVTAATTQRSRKAGKGL